MEKEKRVKFVFLFVFLLCLHWKSGRLWERVQHGIKPAAHSEID